MNYIITATVWILVAVTGKILGVGDAPAMIIYGLGAIAGCAFANSRYWDD